MSSGIANLVLIGLVVAAVAETVAAIFLRLFVQLPFSVAQWGFSFLTATFNVALSIYQKPEVAIAIAVALIFVFGVGAVAVLYTSVFINIYDFVFEGVFRPVYEVVSKIFILSAVSLIYYLGSLYNTILAYFFHQFDLFIADAINLYTAIASSGDYFLVLGSPKVLWNFWSGFFLYLWTTGPLMSRTVIFTELPGLYTPVPTDSSARAYDFSIVHSDVGIQSYTGAAHQQYGVYFPNGYDFDTTAKAYEFNPEDGAFGPPTGRLPGILYYLRNLVVDVVVQLQKIGDLYFSVVEDLSSPGQRFFPNFILSVDAPNSYWRRGADVLARLISFFTGTSLYPANADGRQPARLVYEAYLFRIIRLVASMSRFVNLVIFDSLTVQRPVPTTTTSKGYEFILDKLRAVPVIDLFIGILTPGETVNLNILRTNYFSCKVSRNIYLNSVLFYNAAPDGLNTDGYDNNAILWSSAQCGGTFLGTLPENHRCIKWDGLLVPTDLERVDYLGEFWKIIANAAQIGYTPIISSSQTPVEKDELIFIYDKVIDPVVTILTAFNYYWNARLHPSPPAATVNANPTLANCIPRVASINIASMINEELLHTAEYSFRPKTCSAAYDPSITDVGPIPQDALSCYIGLASQDGNGLFKVLCGAARITANAAADVDSALTKVCRAFTGGSPNCDYGDPLFPLDYLQCSDARRKRSLATETFGPGADPPGLESVSLSEHFAFSASFLASQARKALGAVQSCFDGTDERVRNCDEQCAAYSCTRAVLDCAADRVPVDNAWHDILFGHRSSPDSFGVRNVVLGLVTVLDAANGCDNSFFHQLYRRTAAAMAVFRDWTVRFLLMWTDYLPSTFSCMDVALEMAAGNYTLAEIQTAYLNCLGVAAADDTGNDTVWSDSLTRAGITPNVSWCASMMHERGLVLEDTPDGQSLSAEHAWYRVCMFLFAVGARANYRGTSQHPLATYVDLWRAPLAVMQSTSRADTARLADVEYRHLLPAGVPPFPLLTAEPAARPSNKSTAGAHMPSNYLFNFLYDNHRWIDVGVNYAHYLADLFDHVVARESSGEEKDSLADELFSRRMGVHVHSTAKEAHEASRRFANHTHVIVVAGSDALDSQRRRREKFARDVREKTTNPKVADVISKFSDSLYWSGPLTVASGNQTVSVLHEFAINLRRFSIDDSMLPLISVRPLREPEDALYVQGAGSTSNKLWKFVDMNGAERFLKTAVSSSRGVDRAVSRQLLVRAAGALKAFRNAFHPQGAWISVHDVPAAELVTRSATLLQSLWAIVNRRLRLEGLPPYHAAAMIVDLLSGQSIDQVPAYLNHEKSYLAGYGFVENDFYQSYIDNEQTQRERASYVYAKTEDEYAWVTKATALAYRHNLEKRRKNALGASPAGSFSGLQQRKAHFSKRSAFLVRHDLHDDEHLHLIAPRHWVHTAAARNATTVEQRQFYSVQASFGSGDYIGSTDQILGYFGVSPGYLQSLDESATSFAEGIWMPFQDSSNAFDNYLEWWAIFLEYVACDVAQDVRRGGTGYYKIGCLPYWPERILDWYVVFPRDSTGAGVLSLFEGPGYIEWPDSMFSPGGQCPSLRVPSVQDMARTDPFWVRIYQTIDVSTSDNPTSMYADLSPVFPINFGPNPEKISFSAVFSWLVNITDWCTVSTTRRPLCVVGNDWCQRNYISAADAGFTDGSVAIQVWINDARFIYDKAVTLDAETAFRIRWISICFLLLALANYIYVPLLFFTIPAPDAAYTFVFVALFAEFFFNQAPERFAVVVMWLGVWLFSVPVLAWIQWLLLTVHLVAYAYFDTVLLASVFTFIGDLFPDRLLVSLLNWLGTVPVLSNIVNLSVFTTAAARIDAGSALYVANTANNIYALHSLYYVGIFTLTIAGYVILGIAIGGVAVLAVIQVFGILLDLLELYLVLRALFLVRRVSHLEDDVDDNNDKIDRLHAAMEFNVRRLQSQITPASAPREALRRGVEGLRKQE